MSDSPLETAILALGLHLAYRHGHALASVDPPKLGPGTAAMARSEFRRAVAELPEVRALTDVLADPEHGLYDVEFAAYNLARALGVEVSSMDPPDLAPSDA